MKRSFYSFKKSIIYLIIAAMCLDSNTAYALIEFSSPAKMNLDGRQINLFDVEVPKNIGSIKEKFEGRDGRLVFVIQDAHAIPDAQRNIRRLIDFFQKKYGVGIVALEGAASELDTQIFKSFPDQEMLKKIFDGYFDRGELAGGSAAAIFNESPSVYHGVENWELYEEGLGYFLETMKIEPEITAQVDELFNQLQKEKEKIYSKKLLQIDQAMRGFQQNKSDIIFVLEKLAAIKEPKTGSEIALLLEEVGNSKENNASIEVEVKVIANQVQKALSKQETVANAQKDLAEFNQRFQEFRTSRTTPEAFALFLKEVAIKNKIKITVSKRLNYLVGHQKRLKDIEGTKLFDEFKRYSQTVKEILFENNEQKSLDIQNHLLELVQRLAKLELSPEDWKELQGVLNKIDNWDIAQDGVDRQSYTGKLLGQMKTHINFYHNTEKRDQVIMQQTERLFEKYDAKSVALVVGGFHAQGLIDQLKAKGISYALLMPEVKAMPDENNYRDHMQGKVTWGDYFEVENGKVNLQDAFVRGTRDALLKQSDNSRGKSLKLWRDAIINDLSEQDRITKAKQYTRFIDEATDDKSKDRFSQWRKNSDQFIKGLYQLKGTNQITEQNILKLLQPATIPDAATASASLSGGLLSPGLLPDSPAKMSTGIQSLSELRTAEEDSVPSQVAGSTSRAELRVDLIAKLRFDLQKETVLPRSEMRKTQDEIYQEIDDFVARGDHGASDVIDKVQSMLAQAKGIVESKQGEYGRFKRLVNVLSKRLPAIERIASATPQELSNIIQAIINEQVPPGLFMVYDEALAARLISLGDSTLLAKLMTVLNLNSKNALAKKLYSELKKLFSDRPEELKSFIKEQSFAVAQTLEQKNQDKINLRLQSGRRLIQERNLLSEWSRAADLEGALNLFGSLSLKNLIDLATVFYRDNYDIDLNILAQGDEITPDLDGSVSEAVSSEQQQLLRTRLIDWSRGLNVFDYSFLAFNPYFGGIEVALSGRASHGTKPAHYSRRAYMKLFLVNDETDILFHEMGHAFDPYLILKHGVQLNVYESINVERLVKFAERYGYRFDIEAWNSSKPEKQLEALANLIMQMYEKRRNAWKELFRNAKYYDDQKTAQDLGLWESFISELEKRKHLISQALKTINHDLGLYQNQIENYFDTTIQTLRSGLEIGELTPGLAASDERYQNQIEKRNQWVNSLNQTVVNFINLPPASELVTQEEFVSAGADFHHYSYIYNVPSQDPHEIVQDDTVEGRLRAEHVEYFAEAFRWFFTTERTKIVFDSDVLLDLDREASVLMSILFGKVLDQHSKKGAGPGAPIARRELRVDLIQKLAARSKRRLEEVPDKSVDKNRAELRESPGSVRSENRPTNATEAAATGEVGQPQIVTPAFSAYILMEALYLPVYANKFRMGKYIFLKSMEEALNQFSDLDFVDSAFLVLKFREILKELQGQDDELRRQGLRGFDQLDFRTKFREAVTALRQQLRPDYRSNGLSKLNNEEWIIKLRKEMPGLRSDRFDSQLKEALANLHGLNIDRRLQFYIVLKAWSGYSEANLPKRFEQLNKDIVFYANSLFGAQADLARVHGDVDRHVLALNDVSDVRMQEAALVELTNMAKMGNEAALNALAAIYDRLVPAAKGENESLALAAIKALGAVAASSISASRRFMSALGYLSRDEYPGVSLRLDVIFEAGEEIMQIYQSSIASDPVKARIAARQIGNSKVEQQYTEEIASLMRNEGDALNNSSNIIEVLRWENDGARDFAYMLLKKVSANRQVLEDILKAKNVDLQIRLYALGLLVESHEDFVEMPEGLADEVEEFLKKAGEENQDLIKNIFKMTATREELMTYSIAILVWTEAKPNFNYLSNWGSFKFNLRRIMQTNFQSGLNNANSAYEFGVDLLKGLSGKELLSVIAHELTHNILHSEYHFNATTLERKATHEFLADLFTYIFSNQMGWEIEDFQKTFGNEEYASAEATAFISDEEHIAGRAQLLIFFNAFKKNLKKENDPKFLQLSLEKLFEVALEITMREGQADLKNDFYGFMTELIISFGEKTLGKDVLRAERVQIESAKKQFVVEDEHVQIIESKLIEPIVKKTASAFINVAKNRSLLEKNQDDSGLSDREKLSQKNFVAMTDQQLLWVVWSARMLVVGPNPVYFGSFDNARAAMHEIEKRLNFIFDSIEVQVASEDSTLPLSQLKSRLNSFLEVFKEDGLSASLSEADETRLRAEIETYLELLNYLQAKHEGFASKTHLDLVEEMRAEDIPAGSRRKEVLKSIITALQLNLEFGNILKSEEGQGSLLDQEAVGGQNIRSEMRDVSNRVVEALAPEAKVELSSAEIEKIANLARRDFEALVEALQSALDEKLDQVKQDGGNDVLEGALEMAKRIIASIGTEAKNLDGEITGAISFEDATGFGSFFEVLFKAITESGNRAEIISNDASHAVMAKSMNRDLAPLINLIKARPANWKNGSVVTSSDVGAGIAVALDKTENAKGLNEVFQGVLFKSAVTDNADQIYANQALFAAIYLKFLVFMNSKERKKDLTNYLNGVSLTERKQKQAEYLRKAFAALLVQELGQYYPTIGEAITQGDLDDLDLITFEGSVLAAIISTYQTTMAMEKSA